MLNWLLRRAPDPGYHEARKHSADADANLPRAERIEQEARRLQRENHFAASIRHAMKGR